MFTFMRNWQALSQGDNTNWHTPVAPHSHHSAGAQCDFLVVSWFHLAFPDDWCWAPFPVLIAHLDSFCEVCIQVTDFYIVLLLKWLLQVVFLHMNPLSFTCIASVFSLVMACLFTLIVSSWWEGFNFGEIYQFLSFMVDIFCVLKYLPILRVMEILFSSRRFALPSHLGLWSILNKCTLH